MQGSEDISALEDVREGLQKVGQAGPAAVLYMITLAVMYKYTNKYAPLLLMICGVVAGQFLFV